MKCKRKTRHKHQLNGRGLVEWVVLGLAQVVNASVLVVGIKSHTKLESHAPARYALNAGGR